MTHSRKSRPQALNVNTTIQLFEYLDRYEAKLDRIGEMIASSGRFAHAVATSEYRRDLRQMADFSRLNEKVTKISDLAAAVKAAYDGVIVERDAAKAELETLKAADAIDQAAVDTAEANLAAAEAVIAALTAVADGTPVELPPDTGGSTGGIGGSTGGV